MRALLSGLEAPAHHRVSRQGQHAQRMMQCWSRPKPARCMQRSIRRRGIALAIVAQPLFKEKVISLHFLICPNTPAGTLSDFYTSPQIKDWYKAYVKAIITRNNTITGRLYIEEPCILGFVDYYLKLCPSRLLSVEPGLLSQSAWGSSEQGRLGSRYASHTIAALSGGAAGIRPSASVLVLLPY
jgi:hypothetical protein